MEKITFPFKMLKTFLFMEKIYACTSCIHSITILLTVQSWNQPSPDDNVQ